MDDVAIIMPTTDFDVAHKNAYDAKFCGGYPFASVYVAPDDGEVKQRYTKTVNTWLTIAFGDEWLMGYDGLEQGAYNYIVLMNDDCKPQKNWLADLIWAFGQDDRLGYVAPGQPCRTVGMMEATGPVAEPQIRHIFAVPFGCVVIRREVFRDAGLLDPTFVHYASDTDHQYRARAFGWTSAWCPHVWVDRELHPPKLMGLWEADRRRFYQRWGNG